MTALFGPAGNSISFESMGYKTFRDIPEYVEKMQLDAYEYQCGRGVKISDESALELGRLAKEKNVVMTLHAPYYISLSGIEPEKRQNSIRYILQSAHAVKLMGGNRIVIHSGSCAKLSREEALELASDTLRKAVEALDSEGYQDVIMCIETMGKINQLGTLHEVMELCKVDERILPCIDFGHINARTMGSLSNISSIEEIFNVMENELGNDRMKLFHSHFSKIEFSQKGGEVRHLTFQDQIYGPNFEPVIELILKKNCEPVMICESDGMQAEDAFIMKQYYLEKKG